ncbi:MAG: phytanoyl-CoA dioxygenase family protein [Pseudomonadota bacterium]
MNSVPRLAHLEDYRRSIVEGAPPLPDMAQRMLLDTLGLGNRQAIDFLAFEQPTQTDFEAWILATAGEPDDDLVLRYNAWAQGESDAQPKSKRLDAVDAMPDVLGPEELAHWQAEGFVVVPQAIDAEHCAAVEAALWDEIGAHQDDPDSWYGLSIDGIMVPLYQHPAITNARQSVRLHKAFARLWGTADLWMTIDQLGFNPPERVDQIFQGSGIHWDVSLVQPVPFATQAVIYLTDTAEDQGAFRCVPGFHHRLAGWLEGLNGQNPREVDLAADAKCIPGKAGDCVIWRQDLPHGASPNHSNKPRLTQYLNYYSPQLKVAEEWL